MRPNLHLVEGEADILLERQRKKNEVLAQKIFGKNRRASAPGGGVNNRKNGVVPGSLASRVGPVGVTKVGLETKVEAKSDVQ